MAKKRWRSNQRASASAPTVPPIWIMAPASAPTDGGNLSTAIKVGVHDNMIVNNVAGHAGGDDVGVVAGAARGEGLRPSDARLDQRVAVEADADDGLAAELRMQLAEGLGVLVDDGNRMALLVEGVGQRGAHAATPEDDDVHVGNATRRMSACASP